MCSDKHKQRVLFICTHNSARSQMAEGFLRELYGNNFDAYSAGTHPSRVNPYVITVCDGARETCPVFPNGKEFLHKRFEDPTQGTGDEEAKRALFRRVRDEINSWIVQTFGNRDV